MKIIDEIKNDNVIIYQGYLQNTEELLELAKALRKCKKNYKLVQFTVFNYNNKIQQSMHN